MYFRHLSLSSVILIDSSTESPVHILILSIQAMRGLPRLRAPGVRKNKLASHRGVAVPEFIMNEKTRGRSNQSDSFAESESMLLKHARDPSARQRMVNY